MGDNNDESQDERGSSISAQIQSFDPLQSMTSSLQSMWDTMDITSSINAATSKPTTSDELSESVHELEALSDTPPLPPDEPCSEEAEVDEDEKSDFDDDYDFGGSGAPAETTADTSASEDEAARNRALGGKGEFGDFANGDEDEDGSSSGCFCCTVAEEVEEEWRSVSLRFGTNVSPAPNQKGSTGNDVFTGKYTILSFLPKGIFEQFRRVANIYFLIISVMMAVGTYVDGTWYSSLDPWTTVGPLALIVGLTLFKEGVEDSKRHKADRAVNTRKAKVLCFDGSTSEIAWASLQPGMVVRIEDKGEFPADLVPLVSSEEEGKCYIETANIDGETNLKLRSAAMGIKGYSTVEELLDDKISISFEPPSASIHSFSGTLNTEKKGKCALDSMELLLRGACLRNSKWILGVIVYTGFETKLVMNSRDAPSKLSTVESMVNRMIYCILFAMVVLTSLTTLGYFLWNLEHGDELWYLCRNMRKDGVSEMFADLCEKGSWSEYPIASLWPTFFILYNNFLPISLYVTVELVNVAQAYFVDQDINMYHKEQNTPALARTSNMNGDLGQIEYIFSDKTGTLTCNEMTFRRFSMGTRVFGAPLVGAGKWSSMTEAKALVNRDPVMKHIAQLLSTCHNVVMEDGKYMAESPDEEALVEGAVTLGLEYIGQTGDKISVRADDNSIKKFTLLALIPFSSARKRMSVVVKDSADSIWLYTKGADNIMFDRTASNGFDVHCGGKSSLDKQLEVFAAEGLRTLVLGYRNLSAGEASKWCAQWKQATESLVDREGAMALVASKLEKDLILLGGTGIEDKLQDGVPNAIANIKKAGVKVWVLTGDKMTTAIEIGLSCKLLTRELDLIVLEKEPPKDSPHYGKPVTDRLATAKRTFLAPSQNGKKKELGLVVDGPSLLDILADPEYKQNLLDLACSCVAVVACRVSPAQKQLIVKMVKDGLPYRPITLSIGDGANDVPMIQEAQIGVGISGKEGRQAVNSSDFAIAQFRFLKRLLLVHGRYNYRRISKVIIYSFYKNIVLVIVLFLFACYSSFSGQSLYGANSWCYSGYNFFLGLPPFMLGFFDRDVKPRSAMTFHKLYYSGLKNEDLNVGKMVEGFIMAIWDGALIYFLCLYSVNESTFQANGKSVGINVFGNQVFACMVFAMLYKICLLFASWNAWSIFSIFFSIAFYITFIFAYSGIGPVSPLGDVGEYDFYDIPYHMFGVPAFWLLLLLVPVASFVGHFVIKAIRIEFFTPKQIIVSEHEYLTQHLSVEDRLAIEESFRSNKNFSTSSSTTDDNTALNNDNDMNSSTNGVADEAPQVKIDLAVLDKLHGNMSMAERTGAGHMANRKLRSSFVDNTPAEHSYFARDQLSPRNGNEHAEGMGRRSVSTRGSFNSVRASASPGFETPIAE